MSYTGRIRYREVSSRGQCELGLKNNVQFRDVSAIWTFGYESLTVISPIPKKSVRCREVSTIRRFHCIEPHK